MQPFIHTSHAHMLVSEGLRGPRLLEEEDEHYSLIFGSDRSPRRGDLVRASVRVSGILFK